MANTCENCPHIKAIHDRMIARSLVGGPVLPGIGDMTTFTMAIPDIADLEALKTAWEKAADCPGPIEIPTGRMVGLFHKKPEITKQCTVDPIPTLPSSPTQTACSGWEAARREGTTVSGSESKI